RGISPPRASFASATDAFGDVDAMLIDRYRAHLRARRDERKAGQRVSRILDPDFLVRPRHDTGHDIDGLLRARRDDDLFGLAADCARGPEIVANGLAQIEHAVRIAIAEVMPSEGTLAARTQLSPQLGGACIHERASQVEGTLVVLCRHVDEIGSLTRGGCGFRDRYRPLLAAMKRREGFGKIG